MSGRGQAGGQAVAGSGSGGRGDARRTGLLVSVVLPVRDAEATVGEALRSLAAQTHRHIEIVVVDDGSRDGTGRVVRKWARRDARIRVVGAGRRGLVPALQRGLAEARGPYIARMDADDIAHPERLEEQLALLERSPGLAGCGTGVRRIPTVDITPRGAEYIAWLNAMTDCKSVAANLFVECPLAHPTFLFRTRVLAEAGGYRDRGWPEDYDLLLRLWRRGHRFVSVPRVLLDWRDRRDRLSRTHPAYSLEAFRACRVHHLRHSLLRDRTGVVVWGAGPTGKALAREFQRQGVGVEAFVEVDPRKIGQVIHGAPVVAARDAARTGGRALHVGAVARAVGREAVRRAVRGAGLARGTEFVAMA